MTKIRKGTFTHEALDISVPAEFEMVYCDDCKGKGKVDIDGLRGSPNLDQMFAEDPDFEDRYWNTDDYQQPCPTCHGEKVHEDVVWDSLPPWVQKRINEWYNDEREHQAEVEAERRIGA